MTLRSPSTSTLPLPSIPLFPKVAPPWTTAVSVTVKSVTLSEPVIDDEVFTVIVSTVTSSSVVSPVTLSVPAIVTD